MRNILSFHYNPTPADSVLAHYTLEWNLNDTSGNWYNGTLANGSVSYTTLNSGKQVLVVNYAWKTRVTTSLNIAPKTASVWINKDSVNDPHPTYWKLFLWQLADAWYSWNWNVWAWWALCSCFGWSSYDLWYFTHVENSWPSSADLTTQDKWTHLCMVDDWSYIHLYQNWVEVWEPASWVRFIAEENFWFLDNEWTWDASYRRFYWKMSEILLLNNAWDATKVLDYYNSTKATYWIS